MRPIQASIRLGALRRNLALAKSRAPRSRVWAVVKANAYGHGIARIEGALGAADGLAVLDVEEAVVVRERGWSKPVLLLEGFFEEQEIAVVARHRLAAVVHHQEQVAMLERAKLDRQIDVYLKINTGMNRLGFTEHNFRDALARVQGCAASVTLMTHFADADGASGVAWQLERFCAVTAGLALQRSLANSAAILRYPQTHADWVRPGIMLYGCSPFADESAAALGLAPVMTLASRLIAVRDLRAGDSVGYGCTFTAPAPMRVGIVACGYADGYPRHAPTGTPILVCGRRTRTLGRVAMDMLFADLDGIPEATVGSPATLWGEGLSADEVATSAGTVSYELLCALAPRVPVVEVDSR